MVVHPVLGVGLVGGGVVALPYAPAGPPFDVNPVTSVVPIPLNCRAEKVTSQFLESVLDETRS